MSTFTVFYSDISMQELHLRPYAKDFMADSDAEITRESLKWVAGLHGLPENSLSLDNPVSDIARVLHGGERIGDIQFLLLEEKES